MVELVNAALRTPALLLTVVPIIFIDGVLATLLGLVPFDFLLTLLVALPVITLGAGVFLSVLVVPRTIDVSPGRLVLHYKNRLTEVSSIPRPPIRLGPFGGILSFKMTSGKLDACFVTREVCERLGTGSIGSS
jgi:hypothetical protein